MESGRVPDGHIAGFVEIGDRRVAPVEEDILKQLDRVAVLSLGGGQQREVGRHRLCAEEGSAAEAYFTEDDRKP